MSRNSTILNRSGVSFLANQSDPWVGHSKSTPRIVKRLFLLILLTQVFRVHAQDRLFGSSDDPAEQPNRAWWQTEHSVSVYGGLSLIGPQWRSEGRIDARFTTTRFSGQASGAIRTGLYGTYNPDLDEAYDLLRTVDYVRFRPRRSHVYLRVGTLDRTRLGTGHIVDFFSTRTAWDRRTVGVEGATGGSLFQVAFFSDNVLMDGLVGGRVSMTPFGRHSSRRLRSITLAVNGVTDRDDRARTGLRFHGHHFEFQFEAVHSGPFVFRPFVSFARTQPAGQGLYLGADLESDNFVDIARLHFRLGVQYNSRRFTSGYAGSFWDVRNPYSRILTTTPESGAEAVFEGTRLPDVFRSHAVVSELRILIFERFELWYEFIRNYGIQDLSEMHVRLFLQARRFRFAIAQDRGGLSGFFSLFDDLGSINTLRFESAYRISDMIWVRFDARYTYESIPSSDSNRWFIEQRRFDPLVGLKINL